MWGLPWLNRKARWRTSNSSMAASWPATHHISCSMFRVGTTNASARILASHCAVAFGTLYSLSDFGAILGRRSQNHSDVWPKMAFGEYNIKTKNMPIAACIVLQSKTSINGGYYWYSSQEINYKKRSLFGCLIDTNIICQGWVLINVVIVIVITLFASSCCLKG